jgi:hypothetical protein
LVVGIWYLVFGSWSAAALSCELQMTIRYPVFVREKDSGDMTTYSSISDMQRSLEQIDVENGEYEAWDANATRLILSFQKSARLSLCEVEGGSRLEELSASIVGYGRRSGVDVDQTLLERKQFTAVLERINMALRQRRHSSSLWKRLFGKR